MNCFTADQYTKLVEILKSHMETRFINEKHRQEKRKDEDYDEEVEEALEEEVSQYQPIRLLHELHFFSTGFN